MDKQSVLNELQSAFDELVASFKGLDERAMNVVVLGTWSVKDILAHIAGWQHEMTGALERMARGEKPVPEGVIQAIADRQTQMLPDGAQVQARIAFMLGHIDPVVTILAYVGEELGVRPLIERHEEGLPILHGLVDELVVQLDAAADRDSGI